MNLTYSDFVIDLYDETKYDPASADNVVTYDHYYSSDNPQEFVLTQHGIRVTDGNVQLVRQVCIAALGGKTGIHDRCCVLLDNTITLCCANSVFSLTLPDLGLRWQVIADGVTCFQIISDKEDFLIHGELGISRLDKKGQLIWQFAGSDIFVTPTGRDAFRLEDNVVYATNWEGQVFEIAADTGYLLKQSQS